MPSFVETQHKGDNRDILDIKILQLKELLQTKEREVTVHQQLVSRKLQGILALQEQKEAIKRSLEEAERSLAEKRATAGAVRQEIHQMFHLIDQQAAKAFYQREYAARYAYYQHFFERENGTDLAELQVLLEATAHGLTIVSPETLPANKSRVEEQFHSLAAAGYLCIECIPQQAGDRFRVEQVAAHYYRVNMEGFLLPFLQGREVLVYSTWILQDAWFDLLPGHRLWYDVCAEPMILFGEDPEMKLQHWSRLETADLISYADRPFRELTYYRTDATLISISEQPHDWRRFFERLPRSAKA